MTFLQRVAVMAFGPLISVGVIWHGQSVLRGMPAAEADGVLLAIRWLAVFTGLYLMNHFLAWRYRRSFSLFLTRALIWALIAYICISHLVDLVGENREVAWQMIGGSGAGHPALVKSLRVQAAVWTVALIMSAVCIGFGFEKTADEG